MTLPFEVLAWSVFATALIPCLLFLWNLLLYTPPPAAKRRYSVSILIPARNEERSIESSVRAALASRNLDLEVIVLDDHSEDHTAEIVASIAREDKRLRIASAPPLPGGWCGKQFACSVLASLATRPRLCFIDADVQLAPDGVASLIEALHHKNCALISGFPKQVTKTAMEELLLPLMHFLLLGYLPMIGMRKLLNPGFGAGCGQIFVADRAAYRTAGGHAQIRGSRHDGLTLPKAFRRAGLKTDLCDATLVASCRMYRSASEVFFGLLKNATEGIASPGRILPFSFLLFIGQVLPPIAFLYAWAGVQSPGIRLIATLALLASYLPRIVAAVRFDQPVLAALFHPLGIFVLLGIQWFAFIRSLLRVPAIWKGRRYSTT